MASKYSTCLSVERLRELLDYSPDTGVFTWIKTTSFRVKVNCVAGHLHSSGYITIGIDGVSYRAHRLAWLYFHGIWPSKDIDHIDGNRTNNSANNLREATRSDNMQNLHVVPKHNQSGLIGAHKIGRRFGSKIVINKRMINLGRFATAEEAHTAYIVAKSKLHPFSHVTNPQPQSLLI